MFLNITPTVTNWSSDNKQFSLMFEENPLADFVELPDDGRAQDELWYSNILCGILRGALEMVCFHHGFSLLLGVSYPAPNGIRLFFILLESLPQSLVLFRSFPHLRLAHHSYLHQ